MFTPARVKLLIITCSALFMAMLDNLVLGVALPSIQQSFNATLTDLQWFMNAYTLAFAVLLIPFSSLGERYGRRRTFLIGVAVFTLGSVLSGSSGNSLQLILSRALQGAGGAAIVPLSLTLVNTAFPVNMRPAALGIWSGISGLGLSIGPLVGGLIVGGAPWQLIFWINVPIGIAAILFGLYWLPETKGEKKSVNIPSVALLGSGLFGIIFGLQNGNSKGWNSAIVIGSFAIGMTLLLLYYGYERKRSMPLVKFSLFRNIRYSGLILTGFWMNAGIFGAIFLLTLFLQQAQGYTALEAGIRTMAWTGCTMIAAPLAGLAVGRFGISPILSTGLTCQALALAGFGILIHHNGVDFPFGYQAPLMMLAGAGMGLSFTPLAHGVLSAVPEHSSGEASGINNATRELGGVFGIAVGGLIFEYGSAIRTPADFGQHLIPALYVCAAMILLGLASVLIYVNSSFKHWVKANTAEPAQAEH